MFLKCFSCFWRLISTYRKDSGAITQEETRTVAEECSGNLPFNGFNNASGIKIGQTIMFDKPQIYQTIHNTIIHGTAALEVLYPHTCPGAAMDSSVRYPPPRCHPDTRLRINERLKDWLDDQKRDHKMTWISGLAGTGKSAAAQTFAEFCAEHRRLGAALFFFRSSGLTDPKTVIPSIAYQLASTVPEYRSLLTQYLANDLRILEKTARAQLENLVVEPLSILQMRGHWICEKPLVIILDGIDECEGVGAQYEIVEMIGGIVRRKLDLPLLWLLVSRPEPHLRHVFSHADFPVNCTREELQLDAEARGDIEHYLRDSFTKIRAQCISTTPASWPSAKELKLATDLTGGLFAVACTIVRFVGEQRTYRNPAQRLRDLLAYMTTRNENVVFKPLEMLDLLYYHILAQIPDEIYSTTKRILFASVNHHLPLSGLSSVLSLCNFMRVDEIEFNRAVHKLSAVLETPPREAVAEKGIRIYHTTFRDYLLDPIRSGRFFISDEEIYLEYAARCLYWYKLILSLSPESDSDTSTLASDEIAVSLVSHLKWIPQPSQAALKITRSIMSSIQQYCWMWFGWGLGYKKSHDILSLLGEFDFRRMDLAASGKIEFFSLIIWLSNLGPLNTLMHTQPNNELENTMLESVTATADRPLIPATLPFDPIAKRERRPSYKFLFLGHDSRTCLFWFQDNGMLLGRCRLRFGVSKSTNYTTSDCVVHKAKPIF